VVPFPSPLDGGAVPGTLDAVAKVFLDVGANRGQTLEVVVDPAWGFDRIHCFEPAPGCWPQLEALADDRVRIWRFGLFGADDTAVLHNPGSSGASIFDKPAAPGGEPVPIELRDAAAWFAEHVDAGDEVVMKVNCEGAECDLLDRLIDTGEIAKVDELLVHWDVRKVEGMGEREARTKERLRAVGAPFHDAESVRYGRNVADKTVNWLRWYSAGPLGRLWYRPVGRLAYRIRAVPYNLRHGRPLVHR
jgi:FkbM family methyltransferase